MKVSDYLKHLVDKHKLPIAWYDLFKYLQNISLSYPNQYNYRSAYPFQQVHVDTEIMMIDKQRRSYTFVFHDDPANIWDDETIFHTEYWIPQVGIRPLFWRIWHAIYPSRETLQQGWRLDYKKYKRMNPEISPAPRKKEVQLIPVYFNGQGMQLSSIMDNWELYITIGYCPEMDTLVIGHVDVEMTSHLHY